MDTHLQYNGVNRALRWGKAPLRHASKNMEERFLASKVLEIGKEAEQWLYKEALAGRARTMRPSPMMLGCWYDPPAIRVVGGWNTPNILSMMTVDSAPFDSIGKDLKHLTQLTLKPISWKLKTRTGTYFVSGLDSEVDGVSAAVVGALPKILPEVTPLQLLVLNSHLDYAHDLVQMLFRLGSLIMNTVDSAVDRSESSGLARMSLHESPPTANGNPFGLRGS